jgi:hypothetical protein
MKWWQTTLDFFKWKQNSAKNYWLAYWSWPGSRIYLLITAGLALFNFALASLILKNVDKDIVILHYNVIFGNDFIGSAWRILTLPLAGLLILIFNFLLSARYLSRDKLLSHICQLTTVTANIFICLGLYSIYLINFVNIKF